jgi:hypothetical protein
MATVSVCEVIGAPGNGKAKITDDLDEHGTVKCNSHVNMPWCACREKMMLENLDAGQIEAIDEQIVTVPVVPSANSWAKMLVINMHRDGLHSVELLIGDKIENAECPRLHIGITARGDGRGAIRLMLWDFLKYEFANVPPCDSPVHRDPHFSTADDKARYPVTKDLVTTLSILQTGMCQNCAVLADSSLDVPEL